MNIAENVSLKSFNTLALPSQADYLFTIRSVDDARLISHWAADNKLPLIVLGGGSNIVLRPRVPGVVAHMAIEQRTIKRDGQTLYVTLGGGENWHQALLWMLSQGAYGLENLALIPGSAGAAPVQNIGAYGVEIKDHVDAVEVLDRESDRVFWLQGSECQFGYRDSLFKQDPSRYIILNLRLKLSSEPNLIRNYGGLDSMLPANATPKMLFDAVCEIRRSKLPDPVLMGNAGSFFKNPVVSQSAYEALLAQYPQLVAYPADGGMKLAAGWLIDHAGFKGVIRGQVGIHDKQALVLINRGDATFAELDALQREVVAAVKRKYGVTLEPEPRFYP